MSYIVTKQDVNSKRWTSITSDSTGQYLAACVYSEKIWTSIDYGKSWSSNNNSPKARWLSITSDSTGQYLAACDNGGFIYTSQNYGANWSSNNESSGTRNWYSITSDSTGKYLAACSYGGFIYTSNDSGAKWSSNNESSGIKNWVSITSDSTGQYLAAITYESEIYTSSDYGINWRTTNTSLGYGGISIASSSDGTKIIAGCYLNYYVSTNSGESWVQNYTGYDYSYEHVASNSSGSQFVACDDIGFIYTLAYNVTDVTFESGSEIVKFSSDDTIIDEFTTIPGQLVTELLEDGDYSDQSILNIFENLRKYSYSESIFDIIKYKLAAFFSSIAYAQAYTTIVEELTDKYDNGVITIDEYDEALEVAAKELSDKYPIWYFNSLTKIEAAIIKYRYILE